MPHESSEDSSNQPDGPMESDTKFSETDTETFFRYQIFPKPKPILFSETKNSETETETSFPIPNFPKPKPILTV